MNTAWRVLILGILLLMGNMLRAQSFTVFDIDTSNFPIMKAKFYAFDANHSQQTPLPSEIAITEDGVIRKVLSVSCAPKPPDSKFSLLLSVDISSSMIGNSGGANYISMAKECARYFINNFTSASECALGSYNYDSYIDQDFTQDRSRLLYAVSKLDLENGTDYDKALFLPAAGALEITKHAKYEPVVIFISDGFCNTLQQQTIIAKAQQQGCRVYSVIVGPNCPQSLKDISQETGGRWFENIASPSEVSEIILNEINARFPCEVSWESGFYCDRRPDKINIEWNKQNEELNYPTITHSLVSLNIDPPSIAFWSKAIGVKCDTVITVIAKNGPFIVNKISSSNPLFQIAPTSFTLSKDQSINLTISYTPADSLYSWGRFDIESDKCTKTYFATSIYPRQRPKTLMIVRPNGGEMYVAGSDTTIEWTGIPLSDTVRLEFSSDNGISWNSITDKATGGTYIWRVPVIKSTTCLVRAIQSYSSGKGWIKTTGSSATDNSRALTVDLDGNILVTGTYENTLYFPKDTFTNNNWSVDLFLVKYDPQGNVIWARSFGGPADDYSYDVTTDVNGNVYLTGSFSKRIDFSSSTTLTSVKQIDIFIAKFRSDGSLDWAKRAGGDGDDYGYGIAVDANGNIYVTGAYWQAADFNGQVISTSNVTRNTFLAKYFLDGTLDWVKGSTGSGYCQANGIDVSLNGNIFITGGFDGNVNFSSSPLTAVGQSDDIFICKYDASGNIKWAKQAGGSYYDISYNISVNNTEEVFITGEYAGLCNFGGISIPSTGQDAYVAKYKSDGSLDWVKGEVGTNYDKSVGVACNNLGNVFTTGWFIDTARFDTISLISAGKDDIFYTKYNKTGAVEWARRAGGRNPGDQGVDIKVDDYENIYITGEYTQPARFGSDTLYGRGSADVFTMKIPGRVNLQSDTSDAIFSIVMPSPLSQNIDMGDVLIGKIKDSVITPFVTNGGSYQFRVDSIAVLNSSEFALQSNVTPLVVPVSGSQFAEFRFQPSSPGPKSAQIMVITQAATLYQTITGNGIQPVISTLGNIIDFGTVQTTLSKDTTLTLAITNNGTLPINFTGDVQLGPDKTQFSLLSGGGAFTLQPNESREVSIRFAPRFIGRTSGRIGFNFNGPGSPAVLQLFGQGLGGLVKIEDDSAFAGEKRNVAMTLLGSPSSSLQSIATGFKARVAYNSTVLAPFGGNVVRGDGVDTVTVEGSLGSDNLLTSVPFLAGLGNAEVSSMDLVEFVWLDALGNPADYDVETESGSFKLLGLCEEGGKRLFAPNGQVSIASITPNPASERIQVNIETLEKGRTQVVVMDVLGREIARLYDGEIESGAHTLNLNTSGIAAGSYYLSLVTPTVRKFARVDIAR